MSPTSFSYRDICPKTFHLLMDSPISTLRSNHPVTGLYLRPPGKSWPEHYALRSNPNPGERCLRTSNNSCNLSRMPEGETYWRAPNKSGNRFNDGIRLPIMSIDSISFTTPYRLVVGASHVYNENGINGRNEQIPYAVIGFAFAEGPPVGVQPSLGLHLYDAVSAAACAA